MTTSTISLTCIAALLSAGMETTIPVPKQPPSLETTTSQVVIAETCGWKALACYKPGSKTVLVNTKRLDAKDTEAAEVAKYVLHLAGYSAHTRRGMAKWVHKRSLRTSAGICLG